MAWLKESEMATREPPPWLVQDVLHRGTFAVLVGAAAVGKTFVALDLAFAVATGTTWHGYETQLGPVVYILAEGGGGFGRRIRAWRQHRDIPKGIGVGIWIWDTDVQLAAVANRMAFQAELSKVQAEAGAPPQLIIVDTLARCFVGMDENTAQDMGKFVAGIDVLRTTGAAVLVLHHEGHKKGRERGSTALRAAVDAVLHLGVGESDEGVLVLRCLKQRESEPFETVYLQLKPVPLTDTVTSCVVVDAPMADLPPAWVQAAELLARDRTQALTPKDWFRRVVAQTPMADRSLWRMKKSLLARGMIVEVDGKVHRAP